ncbi:MAG: YfhO family protein, partial [Ruminococcus sp.]|nr:YfhO family protein [Ruminococcus sp.]
MNKKKNIFYNNRFILISFFAAALTMMVVFLITGVYPVGDKTILRMDLYHQYGPLFAELLDKIKSGGSFSYSWVSGLGSCFLGNYFNYLSSPLGAIVVFFGHEHVTEAIAAMIVIKAALSAGTFTFYLKKSQRNHSIITASFGILYAFCGYMLAYYWNIMWLDAMVLLPIVLVGIERIINHGNIWTYLVALTLTFLSNYYMSYMLCLFSVIYFIYYYVTNYSRGAVLDPNFVAVTKKGKTKKVTLRNSRFFRSGLLFAFASILSAGLIAFMLIPVYNILSSSSATTGTFPTDFRSYFKFFDFLANHFASITTTIRSSGDDVIPNVYCGVLTIILAPLFFFTKSISKKEKLTTLGLLAFLYISFNFNFMNYIWHGMHYPNDLPYRFSFIYSFVLLLIAYKTFIRLNEFTSKQIGVMGVAIVAFVFITEKVTSKNATDSTIYITLIFTVFYVLLLTLFKNKKYEIASLAILLCVCTCSEAIIADTSAFPNNITYDSYVSDYSDFRELKDNLDTI